MEGQDIDGADVEYGVSESQAVPSSQHRVMLHALPAECRYM